MFHIDKKKIFNNLKCTTNFKVPRYFSIPDIPENRSKTGNVIFNIGDRTFYGYNGREWIPFGGSGGDVTLTDVDPLGSGTSIIGNGTGPDLTVKKLEPGAGMLITDNGDRLTLDSFGGGGAPNNASYVVLGTDPTLTQERVLTAGTGINIIDGGAEQPVTINADITLGSSGGTGSLSLVNDGTVPNFFVKGLTAGTDVSLTDNGTEIIINATGASSVSLASAGGVSLVNDGTGPNLATKGLTAGTGVSLTDNGTDIIINATGASGYTRTEVNTDYLVLETDDIIAVQNTTSAPITITLPQISGLTTPSNYKKYTIVDEGGDAGLYAITVVGTGGDTILGQSPPAGVSINQNYNSITVYSDGNNAWFVI